jgi:hypothetical protein
MTGQFPDIESFIVCGATAAEALIAKTVMIPGSSPLKHLIIPILLVLVAELDATDKNTWFFYNYSGSRSSTGRSPQKSSWEWELGR